MRGEIYVKGYGTASPSGATDPLVTGGWVDAYDAFGMSLEDTGISRILAPAPNKEPVTNKNVVAQGAAVVAGVGLKQDRTISVPFHIVAVSKSDFISKFAALCNVLDGGSIDIKLGWAPSVIYHFVYIDCPQYTQYDGTMALFSLQLYEPNPQSRT